MAFSALFDNIWKAGCRGGALAFQVLLWIQGDRLLNYLLFCNQCLRSHHRVLYLIPKELEIEKVGPGFFARDRGQPETTD